MTHGPARAEPTTVAVPGHWAERALSGADTWADIATGIWGGTAPQERDRIRQQRKAVVA